MFTGLVASDVLLSNQSGDDVATAPINFTLKWSASVGISSDLQPLMHDVDADGIMEIFMIGTIDGTLTGPARLICLKGDTGALVYQKNIDSGTGGGMHRPLVIADAFNDGRYQVFYSGNGYGTDMTCVWATNGTTVWHTTQAGGQYHVFSVADTDRTGYPYVYVVKSGDANPPTNGKVFKLWATNGSIKSQSRGYEYHCSNGGITIGDANQDGKDEVYVTDRYGRQKDGYMATGLHCFTDDLVLQWNSSVPASSSNAMLADVVPGNDQLEVVVGYQGGNGVENSGIRVIYANGTTVRGKSSADLDLSVHDQPALFDVDKDGGLEFFTCMGTHMKAWDLASWSLDKDFGFVSYCPPVIANVLGDSDKEIVSPSGSGLRVFDSGYHLVDSLSTSASTVIVQDVDADGFNEIIINEKSNHLYYIKVYDTPATALSTLANTRTPFYGDLRQNSETPCGLLNVPPVADFMYTLSGASVTLDASVSYDPDGSLTSYVWDLGDGAQAAGQIVTHDYLSSGTYAITLLVRDNEGSQASITKEITVVKNPEFLTAVIIGKISNLSTRGDSITFKAVKIGVVTFSPLSFDIYGSGEEVSVSRDHVGFIGVQYIFTLCNILRSN
jgi:chitodextrinase